MTSAQEELEKINAELKMLRDEQANLEALRDAKMEIVRQKIANFGLKVGNIGRQINASHPFAVALAHGTGKAFIDAAKGAVNYLAEPQVATTSIKTGNEMSSKKNIQKSANSDYADISPGDARVALKVLGDSGKQVLKGWNIIGGHIKSYINGPTMDQKKQAELAKLQSDVKSLEAQKVMDAQLEELRKKKQALTSNTQTSDNEQEAIA